MSIKKVSSKQAEYEVSSGNIFTDLERHHPDEQLAKVELARHINNLIRARDLTQATAAELLGIDQPKISALAKGKLSGFSLERLFRFLNILGYDITINVDETVAEAQAQVQVRLPKLKKPSLPKLRNSSKPTLHAKRHKAKL